MELIEIIEGCKKNSRVHQKELYNLYSNKMYGVALTYMKDREAAQDILHDSFLKVFKSIKKFDSKNAIEGWIRRIVVNTAIDNLRRQKKFSKETFEERHTWPMAENFIQNEVERKEIEDIINMLPVGAKAIFNLYVIEGYSHKEIAEKLEISEGTSKSQFFRAKSLLKDLLKKFYVVDAYEG